MGIMEEETNTTTKPTCPDAHNNNCQGTPISWRENEPPPRVTLVHDQGSRWKLFYSCSSDGVYQVKCSSVMVNNNDRDLLTQISRVARQECVKNGNTACVKYHSAHS